MKIFFLVVSTLFFIACENLEVKKPSNLISEDQMVEILYDLVLINFAKGVNKNYYKRILIILKHIFLKNTILIVFSLQKAMLITPLKMRSINPFMKN